METEAASFSHSPNRWIRCLFAWCWPDGRDEALDGVRHGAGMACQDGPGGRVFGVKDERAGGL